MNEEQYREALEAADEAIKAAWPDIYAPVGDATYAQKWERLRAARDRYAILRERMGCPLGQKSCAVHRRPKVTAVRRSRRGTGSHSYCPSCKSDAGKLGGQVAGEVNSARAAERRRRQA